MLHGGVRILIRSDLQSAASRLFNHRDGGTRFAPKILAADLEVKNVNRDMRDFGDLDGFLDFLRELVPLTADVRRVIAAVLSGHCRHLEHLLGIIVAAAVESRRKPHRAFQHGLLDQSLHPYNFIRCRRPVLVTDHGALDLLRCDADRNVDGDALSLELLDIAADCGPIDVEVILPFLLSF